MTLVSFDDLKAYLSAEDTPALQQLYQWTDEDIIRMVHVNATIEIGFSTPAQAIVTTRIAHD
jgi:hypothetical protein